MSSLIYYAERWGDVGSAEGYKLTIDAIVSCYVQFHLAKKTTKLIIFYRFEKIR
jgi:hypothetical protein